VVQRKKPVEYLKSQGGDLPGMLGIIILLKHQRFRFMNKRMYAAGIVSSDIHRELSNGKPEIPDQTLANRSLAS
jgi:hypothetical protein